jgi:hypothetical protein
VNQRNNPRLKYIFNCRGYREISPIIEYNIHALQNVPDGLLVRVTAAHPATKSGSVRRIDMEIVPAISLRCV